VLAAAQRSGADAIHPGYGFLSENAAFAQRRRRRARLHGPPASAMRAMGEDRGAPHDEGAGVRIVRASSTRSRSRLLKDRPRRRLPGDAQGRGRRRRQGIRIVHAEAELVPSFERARSEAESSFKSGAVYLEKFLPASHHVEIQVFADAHGHAIHLGERECSMQRRHQKVIEESPSPLMTPQLRAAMGQAAVRAAQAVGYVNAGTIEFLVTDAREFFFLEMNTRLQVEHPVTELVTGLDLVELQLRVAAGEPLPLQQEDVVLRGHAIEARICAEEPERGFVPATGRVTSLDLPGGPGVRLDSALHDGLAVTVHYDSMLAKLIVHAPTREAAIARMVRALGETRIAGVANNVAFLAKLVGGEPFRSGRYHTKSIEERLDVLLGKPERKDLVDAALVAALLHREQLRKGAEERTLHGGDGAREPVSLLAGLPPGSAAMVASSSTARRSRSSSARRATAGRSRSSRRRARPRLAPIDDLRRMAVAVDGACTTSSSARTRAGCTSRSTARATTSRSRTSASARPTRPPAPSPRVRSS
jgi:acetyl/propionyl-CoA carboxylase alpha subunit